MRRPKDVVAAMIKRLAHRNANVQLYTLEVGTTLVALTMSPELDILTKATVQLANALSQNCGPKIHRELASRSFTDALLRLAGDRVRKSSLRFRVESLLFGGGLIETVRHTNRSSRRSWSE